MSSPDPAALQVTRLLTELRARRRRLNAVRWSIHGALAGVIGGCLAAAIVHLTKQPGPAALAAIGVGCTLAITLVGALMGWMAPVGDLEVARALDRAAASDDRFASAVQLSGHHRQVRAHLLAKDAVERVGQTPIAAALPLHLPRTARWLPLPVVALAALLVLFPGGNLQADTQPEPEISASEWDQIHDAFRKDIEKMSKPLTPEEEELQKQIEQLAKMLAEKPDKKDALKEIARLSERVEQQKKALGSRSQSLKAAAKALASSQTLKQFATTLKAGEYDQAADELKKLAEDMEKGETKPTAEEMEALAEDLQKMADQLSPGEMQEACRNSSSAANSMNREALAKALKRLSEQMKKNAGQCRQCDNMSDYEKALEELKRMMNQCRGGKPGNKPGNQPGGGGKGGKEAGWGSAVKWNGGRIKKADEERTPELADAEERTGVNSTFQIVSPDERAASGLKYKELYAEFVHKSEADLDLESVPVAYREYLRRYFNSIRPAEAAPADEPAAPAAPAPAAP